jgi:hypothetical protein
LTEVLERGKKVSKSEDVFSENGKPYGMLKPSSGQPLKRRKLEELDFTISIIILAHG